MESCLARPCDVPRGQGCGVDLVPAKWCRAGLAGGFAAGLVASITGVHVVLQRRDGHRRPQEDGTGKVQASRVPVPSYRPSEPRSDNSSRLR